MEPERPPSLDITVLAPDRFRGELRPAQDDVKVRRLVWSGGSAIFLLIAGITLSHPVGMVAAYCGGFLMLIVTAWNLTGLVNLPVTIELSPTAFSMGEEQMPLPAIDRVDATDGPPKLVVVMKSGERHVWVASEEHHNLDDLAWLAEQVREALPR